jgi:hypothetical protein
LVPQATNADIFARMTQAEIEELFDREGDVVTVKSWIKQGINWHVGDVTDLEFLNTLGPQDIVVANNFLCHMDPSIAERCLRHIACLVCPRGYLFVSGIDLDIRTKVAADLGWKPLEELLEQIYEGDTWMKGLWPCHYAGLEPLDKRRQNWTVRYAAAFQLIPSAKGLELERRETVAEAGALLEKQSRLVAPMQVSSLEATNGGECVRRKMPVGP